MNGGYTAPVKLVLPFKSMVDLTLRARFTHIDKDAEFYNYNSPADLVDESEELYTISAG